jgi:hypothetical protein
MSRRLSRVRCRDMDTNDLEEVVDLLTVGYRIRKRHFWAQRIRRLSEYAQPPGCPQYGHLLVCDGRAVGTIFTIFSPVAGNGGTKIRCYLGSWYVKPEFRSYAVMLAARALRREGVTYLNITPRAQVLPILEAQGYVRFCGGRFITVPLLSRRSETAQIAPIDIEIGSADDFLPFEWELLKRHSAFGCLSVIATAADGQYPFVFQPRIKSGVLRFARLVYCRDRQDFVRFARPLGRFLLERGYPLVALDADGPVDGLRGKYSNRFPKYYRGPDRPRLGDLAYSTRVIFDF